MRPPDKRASGCDAEVLAGLFGAVQGRVRTVKCRFRHVSFLEFGESTGHRDQHRRAAEMKAQGLHRGAHLIGEEHGLLHFRGTPVLVTVSCGITELQEGDAPEAAFDRADAALYRAKKAGKNLCVAA